jgi:K+-transporting ATPase c subunit
VASVAGRTGGVNPVRVASTADQAVSGRDFGFLGEPTVNVLDLNLALDRQFGQPEPVPAAPPALAN